MRGHIFRLPLFSPLYTCSIKQSRTRKYVKSEQLRDQYFSLLLTDFQFKEDMFTKLWPESVNFRAKIFVRFREVSTVSFRKVLFYYSHLVNTHALESSAILSSLVHTWWSPSTQIWWHERESSLRDRRRELSHTNEIIDYLQGESLVN